MCRVFWSYANFSEVLPILKHDKLVFEVLFFLKAKLNHVACDLYDEVITSCLNKNAHGTQTFQEVKESWSQGHNSRTQSTIMLSVFCPLSSLRPSLLRSSSFSEDFCKWNVGTDKRLHHQIGASSCSGSGLYRHILFEVTVYSISFCNVSLFLWPLSRHV